MMMLQQQQQQQNCIVVSEGRFYILFIFCDMQQQFLSFLATNK